MQTERTIFEMSATERWLISGCFLATLAILAWLLATVSANSARISVLEQRAENYKFELRELKEEIAVHRR